MFIIEEKKQTNYYDIYTKVYKLNDIKDLV